MPLLELGGYMPPRPMDILKDAHMFAADHPEVASYVPCYCGCGNMGHKNNADCFVGSARQGRTRHRVGAARRRLRRLHRHRGRIDEDAELRRIGDGDSQTGSGRIPSALPDQRDAHTGATAGAITWREPRADAFARLFEAVHEGVYIGQLGPPETTTLAANPHLKTMFGYAAEAPDAQIQPFDAAALRRPAGARRASSNASASEGAVTDYLLRLRRVDNSPVWVEVTAHADAPSPDGSVRIDALVRDVSERKKLEDQTRDLYHQLLQAEKLAALGQTISGVAHELNNPLATILTWAERLSQRPRSKSTKRRSAVSRRSSASRSARRRSSAIC